MIAERAAGNPFFVEEMVRDLAERVCATGARGNHVCQVDRADAAVPVHPAGHHRRPHRPARPRRQADSECRRGDRLRFGAEQLALLDREAELAS